MNRKRIFSVIMAFCMVLSLLPAEVLAVEWPQAATRANVPQRGTDAPQLVDGYYEIYTSDQLYWFAEQVNGGSTSINGKLMADIVVNENVLNADGTLNGDGSNFWAWTPIGYYKSISDCAKYSGTFDGNGKIVSGLYFNDTSKSYIGLFGYVGSGGKVQNVGVVNSYFIGRRATGGVVGVNRGTVKNCYNTSTVSGESDVGGIVGENYGTLNNCCNTGRVSAKSYCVGGVLGANYGKANDSYNTGSVNGAAFVGGVVGANGEEGSNATISNCYNIGSVSASLYKVGGVAGCNFDGTVSNSYNTGSVSGSGSYVGGVVGYHDSMFGIASNCYYMIGCAKDGSNIVQYGIGSSTQGSTTADVVGNTTGKTTAQFASGEVCYLLQGEQEEQIWGQTIGTDATPTLGGDTVYKNQTGGCKDVTYVYANTSFTDLSHNWQVATCTKPKTCTDCGLTEGDALGHIWSDATCTTAKTCTRCGSTSGNPLGHRWAAATCTEAKTCTVCGATTGTALGHSWKAATCTSPKTCNRCGLTEGNPLGHKWADATCTAPKTCTTCGATSGKALGHIEVVIPGYSATYEAPGLTEGSYCSRCGDTLQEQVVIAPVPEEITFSYQAYGINGSTNAVNSGYITVEIWMNVNTDFARAWGADIGLRFNENLTLLDIQGGIFEESLATPLHIANSYNAVKMTQDMVLGDDKTFTKGQYLFATLTFKVDKNFHSQNAAFLVDVDECTLIRKGEFANELVTDFGTGTNIYISKLGDANLDGKITAADTMSLSTWLQNADLEDYNAVFDLNKDGYIDGDDFALLRGAIVWDNGYLDI